MIELRHNIHQWPEGGFREFKTNKLLRETLTTKYGIPGKWIKDYAKTGFTVDIVGSMEAKGGKAEGVKAIALRCDLDGLPIPENNPGLPYKSQSDHAHMCGHDGHMATLMCTAKALWENRHKIPKNKIVRLLF